MLPRSSQRYETHRDRVSIVRRLRRLVGFVLLVFLVYEATTTLLVQTVEQESVAMQPTLAAGDRLFTLPPVYGPRVRLFGWIMPGFTSPSRGDLVTLRPGFVHELGFGGRLVDPVYRFVTLANRRVGETYEWQSSLQIKRIVGLPGDTIRIERFVAYVRPQGDREFVSEFTLSDREYEIQAGERPGDWQPMDPLGAATAEIELGADEYFVLSDNRANGIDSRHWGAIGPDRIAARVSVRFWPISRFGRP